MLIEEYKTQGCCGKTSLFFKLTKPITQDLLQHFLNIGFVQQQHFVKSGIAYLTSNELVLSGPMQSTRLQVKCRKKDCEDSIKIIIDLLNSL